MGLRFVITTASRVILQTVRSAAPTFQMLPSLMISPKNATLSATQIITKIQIMFARRNPVNSAPPSAKQANYIAAINTSGVSLFLVRRPSLPAQMLSVNASIIPSAAVLIVPEIIIKTAITAWKARVKRVKRSVQTVK